MPEPAATGDSAPRLRPAFDLTEDQRETLDVADNYARNELYPLAPRMDNDEWWPAEAFPSLGKNGYLGVTVPQQYGGGGADLFTSGLVLQAFSRWNHALALSWVAHDNLCANNIFRNADEKSAQPLFAGAVLRQAGRCPWAY